jgi:PTS system D-glucosamine-specific IIC component
VDCCATRLRCTVYDAALVSDAVLKATGASGVVHRGNGVQVIYGPHVTVIKSNLEDYLEKAPDEEPETASAGSAPTGAAGAQASGNAPAGAAGAQASGSAPAGAAGNAQSEKKVARTIVISSPIQGMAADLSTAPDEAFAQKMMGDGAVVTPVDPFVRAPEDGEICFVFDTKHAIGFLTDSGISLLIHVGIDTVKLDGAGFEALVEAGQKVKKGEPMLKLDLDYLKAHAPSLASPVLCTELEDNQKVRLIGEGEIQAGEALFAVDFYE